MSLIPNMDLSYAISDVYYSQTGGLFKADYDKLLQDLQNLQNSPNLDSFYKNSVLEPFINHLMYNLLKEQFDHIFSTHKEDLASSSEKNVKILLPILAEALLQRNYEQKYYKSAFNDLIAFQSIVNTIYQLAAETISSPVAPLVVWSSEKKRTLYVYSSKF